MRILGFKDQYLRASQGAGTWPLVGCQSPVPEVTRKRLLGQTPSDPNGAAWRTIPCSRRAIGRGSTSARTLSTPELDQLRGHTRKVWPDDRRRRPPRHRQCGRRSIAGSRDKRRRTANVLRPEIIPHMGRHHANRSRRYKQLLRGHVVDLRRGFKSDVPDQRSAFFQRNRRYRRALAVRSGRPAASSKE
jgi:hypothetical protein